jgi:hypothetical protein
MTDTELRINKTIKPLDNAIKNFRQIVRATWPLETSLEHPDAIELTEAHDRSPDTKLLNLNNPK